MLETSSAAEVRRHVSRLPLHGRVSTLRCLRPLHHPFCRRGDIAITSQRFVPAISVHAKADNGVYGGVKPRVLCRTAQRKRFSSARIRQRCRGPRLPGVDRDPLEKRQVCAPS